MFFLKTLVQIKDVVVESNQQTAKCLAKNPRTGVVSAYVIQKIAQEKIEKLKQGYYSNMHKYPEACS